MRSAGFAAHRAAASALFALFALLAIAFSAGDPRLFAVAAGVSLLSAYSFGLGLPLFLTALGVDRFLAYFKQVRAYLWGVSAVCGVSLVVVGVLIYANSLTIITSFLEQHGIGWYLGQ